MIKGVNKAIIEVNDTNNRYFERAILFVRPEYAEKGALVESKAKNYVVGLGGAKSSCFKVAKRHRVNKKRLIGAIGLLTVVLAGIIWLFI